MSIRPYLLYIGPKRLIRDSVPDIMNPEYRKKLIALQSHVAQLIAEVESLTVDPNGDDEMLLRVSKQLKSCGACWPKLRGNCERVTS